ARVRGGVGVYQPADVLSDGVVRRADARRDRGAALGGVGDARAPAATAVRARPRRTGPLEPGAARHAAPESRGRRASVRCGIEEYGFITHRGESARRAGARTG